MRFFPSCAWFVTSCLPTADQGMHAFCGESASLYEGGSLDSLADEQEFCSQESEVKISLLPKDSYIHPVPPAMESAPNTLFLLGTKGRKLTLLLFLWFSKIAELHLTSFERHKMTIRKLLSGHERAPPLHLFFITQRSELLPRRGALPQPSTHNTSLLGSFWAFSMGPAQSLFSAEIRYRLNIFSFLALNASHLQRAHSARSSFPRRSHYNFHFVITTVNSKQDHKS